MKNFTLSTLKKLIKQAYDLDSVGDANADNKYHWYSASVSNDPRYYRVFYLIAKTLKPNFVVELGSYRACAATHFAVGNPNGQVITIDIHKDDKPAQKDTIATANYYPNLDYINKWTWDAVEDVKAYNKPIDILFVDAWHSYEYVEKDWNNYRPLLAKTALVIWDDITDGYLFEGMVRWWNELPGQKFLDNEIHPAVPMGFMKYVSRDRPTSGAGKKAAAKR